MAVKQFESAHVHNWHDGASITKENCMNHEAMQEFRHMIDGMNATIKSLSVDERNNVYKSVMENAIAIVLRNENEIIANAVADLSA